VILSYIVRNVKLLVPAFQSRIAFWCYIEKIVEPWGWG
jgi:hypothetical protein